MGLMGSILIIIGSGDIDKLQAFIVVTAVPVSIILLPSLWDAPRIVFARAKIRPPIREGPFKVGGVAARRE